MIEGFLEIQTKRGSYRQSYTFQSTPSLLDPLLITVGGLDNVRVIVTGLEQRFDSEGTPVLYVSCEEADFHADRRQYG